MPVASRIPRAAVRPPFTKIAVILGDPRYPDPVRPDGVISADDRADVDFLRDTLARLSGYEFFYFDSHDALIDDLRAARPDFALNLCDNGFRNDPRRELHVPALLEMLDIPYSGAASACLAQCYDKGLTGRGRARAGHPGAAGKKIFQHRPT